MADPYSSNFTNVTVGFPAPGATDADIGKIFDKNGNQVVFDQQAAIADANGTDDTATINEILTALRNHGLIST